MIIVASFVQHNCTIRFNNIFMNKEAENMIKKTNRCASKNGGGKSYNN